jgi:hypothetical protein
MFGAHPRSFRDSYSFRVQFIWNMTHLHRIDCMLQDSSLSCIILKNPDTNRLIVTSMVHYLHSIHASLRDPNEAKIMRSGDFAPIPPVHVHREQREGTRACEMQGSIKEDGAPAYHGPVTPLTLPVWPCSSLRREDLHSCQASCLTTWIRRKCVLSGLLERAICLHTLTCLASQIGR